MRGIKTESKRFLTPEEQNIFLDYILNHPIYIGWYSLFMIFAETGCRAGEVIGLRWEDLDMENRIVNVNQTAIPPYQKSMFSVPKTGVRTIPMSSAVRQALEKEYETQKRTANAKNGLIFHNKDGSSYTPQEINCIIHNIVNDYNQEEKTSAENENRKPVLLPFFSCHQFRQTFFEKLIRNGISPKAVAALLGNIC